jgi:hypothetical protein
MKTEDESAPETEHEPIRAGVSDVSELPEPEQERIARRHAQGRATAFGFPPRAGELYRKYYRRGIQRPGR